MKRKMIAALLTAVMTCSMSATAFAEGNIELSDQKTEGTTTVKHFVSETYTITIPQSVDFATLGEEKTQKIDASAVTINDGNELKVSVTSTQFLDGTGFRMKDGASETYLTYKIKKNGSAGEEVTKDGVVLSVDSGTQSGSVTLYYSVTDKPTKAGTYTDTLTFTSSVNKKASPAV